MPCAKFYLWQIIGDGPKLPSDSLIFDGVPGRWDQSRKDRYIYNVESRYRSCCMLAIVVDSPSREAISFLTAYHFS